METCVFCSEEFAADEIESHMQQSHHLFFQSQCKANPKPNTQSQSSQSSQSVTNSKCASQSVSNSAISNTSNGCNKLPIQFTITTSHQHSTHPHHSSSCPPIITDINTKTNPDHNSNSNHNGNTNHNHNHHQPTKPVKCRSMRHYTANNHIHIKRNSNHKHSTNNKNFMVNDAWHFCQGMTPLPINKEIGQCFDDDILEPIIFSGTHRIKGGLINNRKSKHPRSESNDDHSRPNKRRKLSHNHNHNKSKEKDKDKNKGKKKDKKDKKKNNKKKNKKKEDNTETNNDDEDEYEDEEQEDPYGGLPYYFHLAAHCEPNLDTDPQRSTNIKQLLCANNTNRDSRSISRCQTNLSTVTTPCSLNTTQYKQNSLLLQPTTENEELLFDEIVSNYEKLLKSKDVKPSVSPPADTSHINMNLNPNYDFALNRDISECIMTPRDRIFDELSPEQISDLIIADLQKYNFVTDPNAPKTPSPKPISQQCSISLPQPPPISLPISPLIQAQVESEAKAKSVSKSPPKSRSQSIQKKPKPIPTIPIKPPTLNGKGLVKVKHDNNTIISNSSCEPILNRTELTPRIMPKATAKHANVCTQSQSPPKPNRIPKAITTPTLPPPSKPQINITDTSQSLIQRLNAKNPTIATTKSTINSIIKPLSLPTNPPPPKPTENGIHTNMNTNIVTNGGTSHNAHVNLHRDLRQPQKFANLNLATKRINNLIPKKTSIDTNKGYNKLMLPTLTSPTSKVTPTIKAPSRLGSKMNAIDLSNTPINTIKPMNASHNVPNLSNLRVPNNKTINLISPPHAPQNRNVNFNGNRSPNRGNMNMNNINNRGRGPKMGPSPQQIMSLQQLLLRNKSANSSNGNGGNNGKPPQNGKLSFQDIANLINIAKQNSSQNKQNLNNRNGNMNNHNHANSQLNIRKLTQMIQQQRKQQNNGQFQSFQRSQRQNKKKHLVPSLNSRNFSPTRNGMTRNGNSNGRNGQILSIQDIPQLVQSQPNASPTASNTTSNSTNSIQSITILSDGDEPTPNGRLSRSNHARNNRHNINGNNNRHRNSNNNNNININANASQVVNALAMLKQKLIKNQANNNGSNNGLRNYSLDRYHNEASRTPQQTQQQSQQQQVSPLVMQMLSSLGKFKNNKIM